MQNRQLIVEIKNHWLQSLALLKPKSANLFFLVTLKTIIRTYKSLFKWWWLAALHIVSFIPSYKIIEIGFLAKIIFAILWLASFVLLTFIIYLAVRPSIAKKDYSYYLDYKWQAIIFFFIFYFVLFFDVPFYFWGNPFAAFFIFFWADSAEALPTAKVLLRAVKLFVFCLPLCLLYSVIFSQFYSWTNYLLLKIGLLSDPAVGIVFLILLPLQVSFLANLYTKFVHDSYSKYHG